jgi:hypothetical protein
MRSLLVILLASIAPCCAFGRTYSISTFAGGGLPENLAGVTVFLTS